MKKKPLVSVSMITYRHEDYIEQAINSVLMQQADFDIELVISNDNSPDKTDAIIQGILKNHSKAAWIKYIKHEKNLGMMANLIDNLRQCTGDYIAFCEGDDYWLDTNKLSMQVNFLQTRPDVWLVFTNRIVRINDVFHTVEYEPKDYTLDDIKQGFIPATQTMMLRNDLEMNAMLANYKDCPSGDRLIAFYCATKGLIGHLNQVSAVYRLTGTGVWSSVNYALQKRRAYQHLEDFHQRLNIKDNKALRYYLEKLLLASLHEMRLSYLGFRQNSGNVFYFSKKLGYRHSLFIIMAKIIKNNYLQVDK